LARVSRAHLLLREAIATLGGRMILGPAYFAYRAWRRGIGEMAAGDMEAIKAWTCHFAGAGVVLYWALGVCGIPLWAYVLFFAYPGTSLTVLRSFAEHRAVEDAEQRTVICEAGWLWSALFLNNNLHKAHHDKPGEVWHKRPSTYRNERSRLLALNGGYLIPGYGVQFAKYFFRAKEPLRHPFIHEF
jgi:fatty acid desaturase